MQRGTRPRAKAPARQATRLDQALVERGLAPSRSHAQALIRTGMVRIQGEPAAATDQAVSAAADIEVVAPPRFVGRGGEKLDGGLEDLGLEVFGRVCLDAGASTGGFTDALLQRGARMVYAVDVGYGQLDWRLRQDHRVVVMERTNIRHLEGLPGEAPSLVVADLSFISLRVVLPGLRRLAAPHADFVLLVKPQFELGRGRVGKGGVVRSAEDRAEAVHGLIEWARGEGLLCVGQALSRVAGAKGNRETFVHLLSSGNPGSGDGG